MAPVTYMFRLTTLSKSVRQACIKDSSPVSRATSAMPVEEPKTVLLDRPFLYAIWDTEANLPVFLGTFTDPAAAQ